MVEPAQAASVNGLTRLQELIFKGVLLYMSRYRSMEFKQALRTIRRANQLVHQRVEQARRIPFCADPYELEKQQIYKSKYPPYATYIGGMTSYPILHKVASSDDIALAIFAKAASVIAIKIIDNINDSLHSYDRARRSLLLQEQSLTQEKFEYDSGDGFIDRAENTVFFLGRCAFHTMSQFTNPDSISFDLYRSSVRKYVYAQIESLRQKAYDAYDPDLSLAYYFDKISTKGDIGNIWLDIDFMVLEKRLGHLDVQLLNLIRNLKTAMEFFYRSFLIYDDLSDLEQDLRDKIINSVVLYALEKGHCEPSDLERPELLLSRLKKNGTFSDVIHLGDLLFLKSVEFFEKTSAQCNGILDVDAYSFASKLTRIFVMRKWLAAKKDVQSLRAVIRSFYSRQGIVKTLPEHILDYEPVICRSSLAFQSGREHVQPLLSS